MKTANAVHIGEVLVILVVIIWLVTHGPVLSYMSPIDIEPLEPNDVNDILEDTSEVKWEMEAQQSMAEQTLRMAKER